MGKRGPSKEWTEKTEATFPPGTFERIASALEPDESRAAFIRTAVFWELEEREKSPTRHLPLEDKPANIKQSKNKVANRA